MARQLRLEFPGAFYHVFSRGNEKRAIFLAAGDYREFLSQLGATAKLCAVRFHAYVLMPNHYHLFLETLNGNLSAVMHRINGIYSQFFNRRHDRVGHLFQGRFKAVLVQKDSYFLALSRYIHRNPVKAGLSATPWGYPWSSASALVGLSQAPDWLDRKTTLEYFAQSPSPESACARFLSEEKNEEELSAKTVGRLFLGDDVYVEEMRFKIRELISGNQEYACKGELKSQRTCEQVLAAARECLGVDAAMEAPWSHSSFRSLAIFLMREEARLPLRKIAQSSGLTLSGVSRHLGRYRLKLSQDPALNVLFERAKGIFLGKSNVKT